MIILSQFEVVTIQFHHWNLTFYPNYVIISKKIGDKSGLLENIL